MPSGPSWWCCCGCDSGTDNFNRIDSTDLGTKWYEWPLDAHGDWRISGDALAEFDGSGYVRWQQHDSKWMICYVNVWWPHAGDTYSLYLDWDGEEFDSIAGTGNCARVDWVFDADSVTISIYSVAGGEDTLLDSCEEEWIEAGEEGASWYQISACITPTTIMAPISGGSVRVDNPGFDGTYAGLGHDCGRIVAFDNWVWTEEYNADPRCPKCGFCSCDETGAQKVANVLDLTYVGYDEGCHDCSSLTGKVIKLKSDRCIQIGWTNDETEDPGHPFADGPVDPFGDHSHARWHLPCPFHQPEDLSNWILTVLRYFPPGYSQPASTHGICGHSSANVNVLQPIIEESSCDPFVLVYEVNEIVCEPGVHETCPDGGTNPPLCEGDPIGPCTICTDCSPCSNSGNASLRPYYHRFHFKVIITEATTL